MNVSPAAFWNSPWALEGVPHSLASFPAARIAGLPGPDKKYGCLAPLGAPPRQCLVHPRVCNSLSFCQRKRKLEGTTRGGEALTVAGSLRLCGSVSDRSAMIPV